MHYLSLYDNNTSIATGKTQVINESMNGKLLINKED
jgi:hypothetical protein